MKKILNSKKVQPQICSYRPIFQRIKFFFRFFNRHFYAVQLFEPGLYILGATPACGKTTFAWQLLNQLAERGETCIFFSYEMSKYELEAKTFARNLFLKNSQTTLTAADILRGGWTSDLELVIDEALHNKNFIVREFSTENVDKLLSILRPIVQNCDKPPVVCIDYLQRTIQRDGKSDIHALIEYTADIVWAMQLNVANHITGKTRANLIRQKATAQRNSTKSSATMTAKNCY